MKTCTTSNSILLDLVQMPTFSVVKAIPTGISKQLEDAVKDFICSSHLPDGIDVNGFYYQTLQAIAAMSYLNGPGELWLGVDEGKLTTYVLAHVGNDIDGRLTYTVTQAWVRKDYRNNPIVKTWWAKIRDRARNLFCKHLIIISSRNPRAYKRFLGNGIHDYCTMLKEEL